MKTLLIAFITFGSLSAFAQSMDITKVTQQAAALTDLHLCYRGVIYQSNSLKSCLDEQDSAREVGLSNQDLLREWEDVKSQHERETRWDRIAEEAARETDTHFRSQIDQIVDLDQEVKNLIYNH